MVNLNAFVVNFNDFVTSFNDAIVNNCMFICAFPIVN